MDWIANQLLNLFFAGWLWIPLVMWILSKRRKLIFPPAAKILLVSACCVALLGQAIGYPHLFGIPFYAESPKQVLWTLFFTLPPLFLLLLYLGVARVDRPTLLS